MLHQPAFNDGMSNRPSPAHFTRKMRFIANYDPNSKNPNDDLVCFRNSAKFQIQHPRVGNLHINSPMVDTNTDGTGRRTLLQSGLRSAPLHR